MSKKRTKKEKRHLRAQKRKEAQMAQSKQGKLKLKMPTYAINKAKERKRLEDRLERSLTPSEIEELLGLLKENTEQAKPKTFGDLPVFGNPSSERENQP